MGSMISIALKFSPEEDDSPRVIASGDGFTGDMIHKIALENGIPIQKNPELAVLLSRVPEGEEIPENLYLAVAKIFAFIYKLEKDLIKIDH
jgi:flagellar biosynthesis protein